MSKTPPTVTHHHLSSMPSPSPGFQPLKGSGNSSPSSSSPPKPDAFCSLDIESDGTNPLQHSMRSIGIALFCEPPSGPCHLDSFYMTLNPQKNAEGKPFPVHTKTMRNFWDKYPEQWQDVQKDAKDPETVMHHLSEWLKHHMKSFTIKWVARPANCDWMWIKCYYEAYGPRDKPDINYYCHDLSSLMRSYELCQGITNKKDFMTALSGNAPYTHNALDDAVCQGWMYMNLRKLLSQKGFHNHSYVTEHQGSKVLVHTRAFTLDGDPATNNGQFRPALPEETIREVFVVDPSTPPFVPRQDTDYPSSSSSESEFGSEVVFMKKLEVSTPSSPVDGARSPLLPSQKGRFLTEDDFPPLPNVSFKTNEIP